MREPGTHVTPAGPGAQAVTLAKPPPSLSRLNNRPQTVDRPRTEPQHRHAQVPITDLRPARPRERRCARTSTRRRRARPQTGRTTPQPTRPARQPRRQLVQLNRWTGSIRPAFQFPVPRSAPTAPTTVRGACRSRYPEGSPHGGRGPPPHNLTAHPVHLRKQRPPLLRFRFGVTVISVAGVSVTRYPDGGGLTAKQRARREEVRFVESPPATPIASGAVGPMPRKSPEPLKACCGAAGDRARPPNSRALFLRLRGGRRSSTAPVTSGRDRPDG